MVLVLFCSTYNYAGKLNNRLFTAYLTKDTEGAMLEQRRSQALVKVVYKYGMFPTPPCFTLTYYVVCSS